MDETDGSDPYETLERHINKVKMYTQQIGSKRLQAEADQERRRQKKEKEKDQWDKIFKKGAYKELPKKKKTKKKSGEQDLTLPGTRTSEGAREETQALKKKKKKGRRKQEETLYKQLDRIFQDNQVETLQRNRVDLLPRWFIVTSLLFWYLWTYRTIPGLCLFLWSFTAIFTIYKVNERDEAGRIR